MRNDKSKTNNNNIKKSAKNIKADNKNVKKAKTTISSNSSTEKKEMEKYPLSLVKKLSIWEKVFNVQQNVAPVMKRSPNEGDGYAYTRERDIIAEVKPMLKEQRLTYTFTTKHIKSEDKNRKLTIAFKLVNVDNPAEYIITDIIGEGVSKEDSGAGTASAYTMALKYYFSKLFLVEIEDSLEDTTDKKNNKAKEKKPDQNTEYEKSKNLIDSTRNIDGLIEYQEQVRKGKFFTNEQKIELDNRISKRLTELQNGK